MNMKELKIKADVKIGDLVLIPGTGSFCAIVIDMNDTQIQYSHHNGKHTGWVNKDGIYEPDPECNEYKWFGFETSGGTIINLTKE